jgi:hypothetical protein
MLPSGRRLSAKTSKAMCSYAWLRSLLILNTSNKGNLQIFRKSKRRQRRASSPERVKTLSTRKLRP